MTKEEKQAKNKAYYLATKEKRKKEYEENKENYLKKVKQYRESNKDKINERQKIYRESNKDKINLYFKNRKANDVNFKLKSNIRTNISNAIKRINHNKQSQTEIILGCSFDDFKNHIESLWQPWMNWDNYGLYNGEEGYGWDIDHIRPQSNGITYADIVKLNHYTNLQPLCSYQNRVIKKG